MIGAVMGHDDYRTAIAEYIRAEAQPPDKLAHQPRLYVLARTLADGQAFDDDVLYAAAWMHDLGVFVGHRPTDLAALAAWDHVAYVLKVGPEILRRLGFPEEKIAAVNEAIRTHLPSRRPTSFEGTLLRDADLLEQLGAVGILRTVSKVGRDTRFRTHGDAVRALERAAQELPALIQLPLARQLAEGRVALMTAFFAAVAAEDTSSST